MLEILVIVTVVAVGLMVGVEFAVAAFVNPIFDRLPDNGGLAARSDGARVLGKVMPVWYIGSLALGSLWAAAEWGRPQALPVTAASALLAVSVVMSVVLLVPINSRVARWSAGSLPPDWRAQLNRWDGYHYLRVAIIVAAFTLLVIASVG
jgi:uncharacterized membrane protein